MTDICRTGFAARMETKVWDDNKPVPGPAILRSTPSTANTPNISKKVNLSPTPKHTTLLMTKTIDGEERNADGTLQWKPQFLRRETCKPYYKPGKWTASGDDELVDTSEWTKSDDDWESFVKFMQSRADEEDDLEGDNVTQAQPLETVGPTVDHQDEAVLPKVIGLKDVAADDDHVVSNDADMLHSSEDVKQYVPTAQGRRTRASDAKLQFTTQDAAHT